MLVSLMQIVTLTMKTTILFLLQDKASTKLFGIIMDRIEKGNQVDYISK